MPDVRAVEDLREGAGGRMALVGASSRGLVAPPCSPHSRRTNAQELQTATEEEVQKMMIPPGHVRRMEGRTTNSIHSKTCRVTVLIRASCQM